jgi:hypothetical protein
MTGTPTHHRRPVITRKAFLVDSDGHVIDEIEVRLYGGRVPLYLGIGEKNWLLHETLPDGVPRYMAA